ELLAGVAAVDDDLDAERRRAAGLEHADDVGVGEDQAALAAEETSALADDAARQGHADIDGRLFHGADRVRGDLRGDLALDEGRNLWHKRRGLFLRRRVLLLRRRVLLLGGRYLSLDWQVGQFLLRHRDRGGHARLEAAGRHRGELLVGHVLDE